MKYNFRDLVDMTVLQNLMEEFCNLTGIPHAILDPEANILSFTGWQDICTKFHRVNPECNKRCIESDRSIKDRIDLSKDYSCYTCKNGLQEYFTPIMIEGQHVATLFLGQVFDQQPDLKYFRKQAQEFGFNEESYLAALAKVPVISHERVDLCMKYFVRLAEMLSYTGLNQLKQKKAEEALRKTNERLEALVTERTAQLEEKNKALLLDIQKREQIEKELAQSERKFREVFNHANEFIFLRKVNDDENIGEFIEVNNTACERLGYTREEILKITPADIDLRLKNNPKRLMELMHDEKIYKTVDTYFITKNGQEIPIEMNRHAFELDGKMVKLVIGRDLTERINIYGKFLENEHKYKALFDNSVDAIFVQEILDDGTGSNFLEVNETACLMYGYTRQEFLSMKPTDIDINLQHDITTFSMKSEKGITIFETTHITKKGDLIPVEINVHFLNLNGKKVRHSIVRDITERKRINDRLIKTKEQYKSLFENNPNAIISIDLKGNITSFNNACRELTGYSNKELLSIRQLHLPEDYKMMGGVHRKIIEGKTEQFDSIFIHKDGRRIEVNITAVPILVNGEVVGMYGVAKDITQRNMIARELRESENKYRALFDNAYSAIFINKFGSEEIEEFNNTASLLLGYNIEEINFNLNSIMSDEFRSNIPKMVFGLEENGVYDCESSLISKSGRKIPVELRSRLFTLNNEKYVITFARDITKRKEDEANLIALSELHKKIIYNVPIGLFSYDLNGNLTMISEHYYKIAEVTNVNIVDKINKINVFRVTRDFLDVKILKDIIQKGEEYFIPEKKITLLNGKEKYISFRGVPLYDKDKIIGGLVIIEDVSERRKVLEEIHLAKARFSKLFYSSPNMMMVSSLDEGRIIYVNNNFTNILGYKPYEVIGKTTIELQFWAEEQQKLEIRSLLKEEGTISNYECKLRTKLGETKLGLLSAELIENNGELCILGTIVDITERKRTERLTILGELATSIAHEIKNPLAIIKGYAEIIEFDESNIEEDKESIEQIIRTVDRLDRVVNSVLSFAKLTDKNLEFTNINTIVTDAANFIRIMSNKKGVRIRTDLNVIPNILVDVGQIYQAFFNLLLNGVESMERGGDLQVKTWYNSSISKIYAAFNDQGAGISQDNLDKIFNPFYSTKKSGSGLGLAIVSKIIKEHGGTIEVTSQKEKGSTFVISLPITN